MVQDALHCLGESVSTQDAAVLPRPCAGSSLEENQYILDAGIPLRVILASKFSSLTLKLL